jgi:hypothetical protein
MDRAAHGLLEKLEYARLEYIKGVEQNDMKGYEVLQRLALYGQAIQSVKDALAHSKAAK